MPNYAGENSVEELLSDIRSAESAPSPAPEPQRSSWWSRLWGGGRKEERFIIRPKWARETVKLTAWPLEKYVHPAWKLTDVEADESAGEMQVFLQAVADRYAPLLIARFASRHSELFDLCAALAVMYWHKLQVVDALIESQKPGKPVPVPIDRKEEEAAAPDEIAHPEAATGAESVLCEKCDVLFPNSKEAAKHLPCPGKKPNGAAS